MNDFGRVSVCGAISTYNRTEPVKGNLSVTACENKTYMCHIYGKIKHTLKIHTHEKIIC